MLVVLDSTVLIDYLRGRPVVERVTALQASGDVPATTSTNVEEIVRGMRQDEVTAAERLCRGLVVLPTDEPCAWLAGNWRRSFAQRGITLSQADCLIAAASFGQHATLCTVNPADFPMAEITLQQPVGR